jgi:transposase-like protein
MNRLHFTQSQVKEILSELARGENGAELVLKLGLEAIMLSEREEHNRLEGDLSNGYRLRKTFGQGKLLELSIPRSRRGHFYPLILSILKDQEEEARKLAFSLYGNGLTEQQVGELFGELYGRSYSVSQISRMFDFSRKVVSEWLTRPLESYYPILLIDATYISTRRIDSVSKEAYYTILGVREDRTREVLAIVNIPTESSYGWEAVFRSLLERGVKEVGLLISDGLSGIENAIWKIFPKVKIQLCVVHLQRNVLKYIRPKDKSAAASDLKDVFRINDSHDNVEQAWNRWTAFCDKWGRYYSPIARMKNNERYKLYFTYLDYHYRIRSMIYTTNWIERLNRSYKRTTRMRGALPNPEATMLLLGYVAMNRNEYLRKIPFLDYENKMFRWTE